MKDVEGAANVSAVGTIFPFGPFGVSGGSTSQTPYAPGMRVSTELSHK